MASLQTQLTSWPVYVHREINHHNNYNSQKIHLPSMDLLHHGHFVSYGGGYYSYLFAKMYAGNNNAYFNQ